MKIGIIFALDEEIEALKKEITITSKEQVYDLTFYTGSIDKITCILVKSGVGKVNAARTTQIMIDRFNISYIFNIGVAGGLNKSLKIGDIVIGEKLVQHDFDITAFNHEKGYIPNIGIYTKSDSNLVSLAKEVIGNCHLGVIASGDIFCTEDSMSQKINKKFQALCVEMESASIAQVARLSQVPFLVIRSISDIPGQTSLTTYEEFLEENCQKVARALKNIIKSLKK